MRPNIESYPIIKIAQYLSGLTAQQDIWSEVGKSLISLTNADLVAFAEQSDDGKIGLKHLSISEDHKDPEFSYTSEMISESIYKQDQIAVELETAVTEIIESGFFVTRQISDQVPISLACFPISIESKLVAVMIVGYVMRETLQNEFLDLLLAVTRLVNTIASRLNSERELKQHRLFLEQMVEKRTTELTAVNKKLNSEIEQRKEAEKALGLERDNLLGILGAMEDCIYIVNADYRIEFMNPAFKRTFSVQEVNNNYCYEILTDSNEICPFCNLDAVLEGKTMRREWQDLRYSKTYDIVETPLKNSDGTKSALGIFRDITSIKINEEKLKLMASTDMLTGLWNRRHFIHLAEKEFERALRYKQTFSLMLLDIDHFKKINDTVGHAAGDYILQYLSGVMRSTLRKVDIISRFGGEEFCIICPNTDLNSTALLAERLRKDVNSVPGIYNGKKVPLSVSIGVVEYEESYKCIEQLISAADQAMYEAKDKGRNNVVKKTGV
jgi:diguanylate cyclase (GGDEF)-like protein